MAMKKVSDWLTVYMFENFWESVKQFVSNDQGFLFMNQISGLLPIGECFKEKC